MNLLVRNLFIRLDEDIEKALSILNNQSIQISLVVDEDNKLIGTITDGDIRRGLLKGFTLKTKVIEITNKKFQFIFSHEDHNKAKKLMIDNQVNQIPVLDKNGIPVDILTKKEIKSESKLNNIAFIMAGGLGKRLLPHTSECPKPMLYIGDKPILEIIIIECIENGFREFYISVNYLKEKIIQYFGDGSKWGIKINYIVEPKKLGTAGSLKLLPKSISKPFLVLNGDVLTRLNFRNLIKFHEKHNLQGTMCVKKHEVEVPYGVVNCNGIKVTSIEEKPSYEFLVNAGVYVIDPVLLKNIPVSTYIDMPTLLQNSIDLGQKIAVCPIYEYWIDIGRPETLKEALKNWENN